jgi:hypothetical protein
MLCEVILIYKAFILYIQSEIPKFSNEFAIEFIQLFIVYFENRLATTADRNLLYLVSVFIPAGRRNRRHLLGLLENEQDDILDQVEHDDSLFFQLPESTIDKLKHFKETIVNKC